MYAQQKQKARDDAPQENNSPVLQRKIVGTYGDAPRYDEGAYYNFQPVNNVVEVEDWGEEDLVTDNPKAIGLIQIILKSARYGYYKIDDNNFWVAIDKIDAVPQRDGTANPWYNDNTSFTENKADCGNVLYEDEPQTGFDKNHEGHVLDNVNGEDLFMVYLVERSQDDEDYVHAHMMWKVDYDINGATSAQLEEDSYEPVGAMGIPGISQAHTPVEDETWVKWP